MIAVDDSNQSIVVDVILKIYSLFKNKLFRQRLKSYYEEKNYHNSDKSVLILKPSVRLPTSIIDNNRDHIIKTIQIGYNDTIMRASSIRKILSG